MGINLLNIAMKNKKTAECSKQKMFFEELANKRLEEIEELSK